MGINSKFFPDVEVAGKTDLGRKRDHNEDSLLIRAEAPLPPLIAVADGVGGASQGKVASEMTLELLQKQLKSVDDPLDFSSQLPTIIEHINQKVLERAQKDGVSSMGTTLTGVLFVADTAVIFNVGDSRVYRMRDGNLKQLTDDHSLVNQMIKGGMDPEEAASRVNENIITRMIGMDSWEGVDIFYEKITSGDIFLACSDGLNKHVEDGGISSELKDEKLQEIPSRLVEKANQDGGTDNITVAVAEIIDSGSEKLFGAFTDQDEEKQEIEVKHRFDYFWLIPILLVLLILIIGFIYREPLGTSARLVINKIMELVEVVL